MSVTIPKNYRRAASRDTTPSLPNSQHSEVCQTASWPTAQADVIQSSRDSETTVPGKVKQVIACCRRHIERFASTPRSNSYAEGESADSSSCFELRRPKSNGLPMQLPSQTQPRSIRTSRPRPLNLQMTRQQSYQFYMDEDIRPFITTPSCVEEDISPKLMTIVTPPSQ